MREFPQRERPPNSGGLSRVVPTSDVLRRHRVFAYAAPPAGAVGALVAVVVALGAGAVAADGAASVPDDVLPVGALGEVPACATIGTGTGVERFRPPAARFTESHCATSALFPASKGRITT